MRKPGKKSKIAGVVSALSFERRNPAIDHIVVDAGPTGEHDNRRVRPLVQNPPHDFGLASLVERPDEIDRFSEMLGLIATDLLRPTPGNAHTHPQKQLRQLAKSIRHFGFISPIIVDDQNRVIAGHARLEAAKILGLKEVPVVRVSHLTPTMVRAYMLADNRLAEQAGWDPELLRIELRELTILLPQIDLDLSITGFEVTEFDACPSNTPSGSMPADVSSSKVDDIPAVHKVPVAHAGDLFVLGGQRLLVGNPHLPDSYARLMGHEAAAMAILDSGSLVAHADLSKEGFIQHLKQALRFCVDWSADGAIHYVFTHWQHMSELLPAAKAIYTELKDVCVWAKNTSAPGSFYRSQHDLVLVLKHGTAPHLNNFEPQHGLARSNVWHYADVNSSRPGRRDGLKMHPPIKPVVLIADVLHDCSRPGDVVLATSTELGTILIAAEQTGRRAFCMEINPLHADVSIRRWQACTKRKAILERTGQTFEELMAQGTAPERSPKSASSTPSGVRKK